METPATSTPLTMTEAAAAKAIALMAEDDSASMLRIAVTGGGCSGFQYALGFDSEIHEDDLVFDSEGVEIVVDESSLEYLNGSVIEFSDGLQGKGFNIVNPNATGCCGCGQSFSC